MRPLLISDDSDVDKENSEFVDVNALIMDSDLKDSDEGEDTVC